MKIYDLHTHVLPGVDDGAPNLECALQMLKNAAASDVSLLAVTPHCNCGRGNYLDADLKQRFRALQQAAKDIPVQLVLGGEVRVNADLPGYLRQGLLPTLNGSRYLLTEFLPDTRVCDFVPALQEIRMQGYIPLVAHPERYEAVCQDPQIVIPWLDMGCHLQLTGASILGSYGKTVQHTTAFLLKNDLVACVASDAHGQVRRSNFIMDVFDHLTVRYSKQYAGCLMYENPMRICHDEEL